MKKYNEFIVENMDRRKFIKGLGAFGVTCAIAGGLSSCNDDDARELENSMKLSGTWKISRINNNPPLNDSSYLTISETGLSANSDSEREMSFYKIDSGKYLVTVDNINGIDAMKNDVKNESGNILYQGMYEVYIYIEEYIPNKTLTFGIEKTGKQYNSGVISTHTFTESYDCVSK